MRLARVIICTLCFAVGLFVGLSWGVSVHAHAATIPAASVHKCFYKVRGSHSALSSEVKITVIRNTCPGVVFFRAAGRCFAGARHGRWVTRKNGRSLFRCTPTTFIWWGYQWHNRGGAIHTIRLGGVGPTITPPTPTGSPRLVRG